MPLARNRPSEIGTTSSPRAWMTSVGTRTWLSDAEMSICPRASSRLRRDLAGGRLQAEVVEPLQLLVGAAWNEARGEDLPERRVVARPGHARQFDHGPVAPPRQPARRALERAARVAAVEDQPRHPFRMAQGVLDAGGSALGNTQQRGWFSRLGRFHDGLEVRRPRVQDERRARRPVAHAAAALVVAHEAIGPGKELQPVFPHRARPLVLEVGQPVGGLDHRRAGARVGPGQPSAIRGGDEAHVLAEVHDRAAMAAGTFVSHPRGQSAANRDKAPMSLCRAPGHPASSQEEVPCSSVCSSSPTA